MKPLIIVFALAATVTVLAPRPKLPTAWDNCKNFAYNHYCTVWEVPDSLWVRLEQQALHEGVTVEKFVYLHTDWRD